MKPFARLAAAVSFAFLAFAALPTRWAPFVEIMLPTAQADAACEGACFEKKKGCDLTCAKQSQECTSKCVGLEGVDRCLSACFTAAAACGVSCGAQYEACKAQCNVPKPPLPVPLPPQPPI